MRLLSMPGGVLVVLGTVSAMAPDAQCISSGGLVPMSLVQSWAVNVQC